MTRGAAILWPALALAGAAHAGVYTHVDPVSGMTILNNLPPARPRVTVNPAPRAAPAGFPHISQARQQQMDGGRRAILQEELESEQQAFDAAAAHRADAVVLARHAANLAALRRELAGVGAAR